MRHAHPIWRRGPRLLVLLLLLALAAPFGCGSEESKMDRGIAVDREIAAPDSPAADAMTEAERRAKEDADQ